MTGYRVHDATPAGFELADDLQVAAYNATGFVNGAAKVALVKAPDGDGLNLAVRLRPPREWTEDQLDDYKDGWADGKANRGSPNSTDAYNDGWLDAVWDRMKWHLAYCTDHHQTQGCGVAG